VSSGNAAEYDFIVVGGGSAGSVLGARLSEGGDRVLLLEAGAGRHVLPYDLPFLAAKLFSFKANNWAYECLPQQGMNGRRQLFPRGRMLGGSFIFNGAQYIRGNPADFDHWRQLGNPGWGYEDVLPYFRKSEDYRGTPSPYHGTEGRLPVAKPPMVNPLTRIYLQACAQAGHPLNGDFNGASQDGFGIYDFNIAEGRRMTTARAFLRPAMARPNLHVATGALVRRVILRDGQAVGVEYERGGKIETAMARREIVLAAGSFNSPKLLMLSGIGDPRDLAPHGISVTHVLRGVGKNLQDHVNVSVAHAAKQPISFARTLRVHRLAAAMLQGVLLKRGQITQSPLEAGGFFSSRDGVDAPEFQAVFIPWYPGSGLRLWMPWADRLEGHSFVTHVWPNRPESRGRMWLASNDPKAPPVFDPNFLSEESDLALTRAAIRETRRIFAQPAFDAVRGEELAPGADMRSDDELDQYIRQSSGIGHHTCGTARMGQDPMAVVDHQLRVHGIGGLRVADASIMPTMVSGNTNAATIMIAEKAADMMLGAS
jgi:choline dehydrogenase